MRRLLTASAGVAAILVAIPAPASALQNPTTGQRGAPAGNTCGSGTSSAPGATSTSPGSPFNLTGQAGNVYAGNSGTASMTHANSTAAVSEYDIGCFRPIH